jgi:hypothetical protein
MEIQGARAVPCKEIAVVKECATFIDHHEFSGNPYVALDYITPDKWYRVKGIAHFCPKHAEQQKKQKYSLPDFKNPDTTYFEVHEEPTRKIKLIKE